MSIGASVVAQADADAPLRDALEADERLARVAEELRAENAGLREPFTRLGDHVVEQLDWQVTVRVVAHCRHRYRRACRCPGPAAVTAPGPPKAIGKGLLSTGFIAMLVTERYVAGRSQNSLVVSPARHGAEISPATPTGTAAAAGTLLTPLEAAIRARSRDSWHLHADETT